MRPFQIRRRELNSEQVFASSHLSPVCGPSVVANYVSAGPLVSLAVRAGGSTGNFRQIADRLPFAKLSSVSHFSQGEGSLRTWNPIARVGDPHSSILTPLILQPVSCQG